MGKENSHLPTASSRLALNSNRENRFRLGLSEWSSRSNEQVHQFGGEFGCFGWSRCWGARRRCRSGDRGTAVPAGRTELPGWRPRWSGRTGPAGQWSRRPWRQPPGQQRSRWARQRTRQQRPAPRDGDPAWGWGPGEVFVPFWAHSRPGAPWWAPFARVYWSDVRNSWGFWWGPFWFPAY